MAKKKADQDVAESVERAETKAERLANLRARINFHGVNADVLAELIDLMSEILEGE